MSVRTPRLQRLEVGQRRRRLQGRGGRRSGDVRTGFGVATAGGRATSEWPPGPWRPEVGRRRHGLRGRATSTSISCTASRWPGNVVPGGSERRRLAAAVPQANGRRIAQCFG
jgi:hypothetical protein